MTGRRAMTVALILAAVVSCRPDDQRTDDLDPTGGEQSRDNMSPEAVAQLDSGSVAFRRDDYEAALAHYTRVAELEPDFGAGWFGIYMAQRALGNEEAATAALEQAESIVPGASLLYEEQPDTGR